MRGNNEQKGLLAKAQKQVLMRTEKRT